MKFMNKECPFCGGKLAREAPENVVKFAGVAKAPCPKCGRFLGVLEPEVASIVEQKPE